MTAQTITPDDITRIVDAQHGPVYEVVIHTVPWYPQGVTREADYRTGYPPIVKVGLPGAVFAASPGSSRWSSLTGYAEPIPPMTQDQLNRDGFGACDEATVRANHATWQALTA
jgi:hypothetical protein